jgi:uncharacterized protein (TIGR03437 family)
MSFPKFPFRPLYRVLTALTILSAGAFGQTPTVAAAVNWLSGSTTLCPGLDTTIYGTNFGTDYTKASVTVDTQAAYVSSAGYDATQMIVQLPFGLSVGSHNLTVTIAGAASAPFAITIAAVSPSFITANGTGSGLAIIYPANSATPFSLTNPATPGAIVTAYLVGLGPTTPVTPIGNATAPNPLVPTPIVTVGGVAAKVLAAVAAPSLTGVYQVNFTLPSSGIQGTEPLVITLDGVSSSDTVTLPIVGLSAVANNASFAMAGTIAPGSIASIFANGLGSASSDETSLFPTTLSEGVQVTFNGIAAPLFHLVPTASPQQIDLFVPSNLSTTGTVNVQLTTSSANYPNYTLNMVPALPGIYRFTDPKSGTGYAIAQFANTAWVVLPASTTSNIGLQACAATISAASECGEPANIGDYLTIYMTGLGLATVNGNPTGGLLPTGENPPADGSVLYETPTLPTVTIGGVPATVLFSGLVPGYAGEYQVDVQVPTGVASGDNVPIVVTMLGASDTAFTSIQPSRIAPPKP